MSANARTSRDLGCRPAAEALEHRWLLSAQAAPAAEVTDRRLIYNNSVYAQYDSDPIHDLGAIARDKRALLPGQGLAGFENLSSYVKGINGILVQFFSLGFFPHDVGPDDFDVRVGTLDDPSTWKPAPAPTVAVIPVPGPNQLYTLSWPDYTIRNTWLRATVKANDHTGLATPDVFYFGNLVGETGDGDSKTRAMPRVTAIDLARVRREQNTDAPITSVVDFNRDGRVNAIDLAAARANDGRGLPTVDSTPSPIASGATASGVTALVRDDAAALL